ncbi:MAG: AraC-like DNA-binding protein [Alteromonadaceae bacterium]|jgi:AraC-like DNA-binding protein
MKFFEHHEKVLRSHMLALLLVDLVKQRGVHPDKILKGTKLFYQDLAKASVVLSHQQWVRLVMNTCKLNNQHDIPFLLGRQLFPAQLGNVGFALMNTHNLNDMLRVIKCYQGQIFPYLFMSQRSNNGTRFLFFNQAISIENKAYFVFMSELLLSALTCAIKWRMGYVPTIAVRFPYQRPTYVEQYQAYLPFPCSFCSDNIQENVQISIAEKTLQQPFNDGNRRLLHFHLRSLPKTDVGKGLVQSVWQIIERYHRLQRDISLDLLASELDVSAATLKRKLTAHHTNYQKILDRYRQQQAIFSLREQGYSTEKVAQLLSFTDITNFRRSFKRWTGITPSALKQSIY